LPNVSGTIPVLAAASATAITSTPAELNKLYGATVVVGEINALDLGSTAVGTAIASKAVILDSSKDYAGIRNLTISGEIDAATGDYSGAVDIAGATTTAAITASGIIKTDDSTAATSTTDGSLQTDGGLSVVLDAVIGDDLLMLSDASVIHFGADSDVTLTHVADTGLLLNGTSVIQFNDASQNIGAPSNAILDINATDEVEINATLIDVNGNLDVSGTGVIAGVLTANAGVVVDELTIDADTITATDDFIIDAAGDITLDAGGGDVNFADDGTGFAFIARTGNNAIFGNPVSDGKIFIQGSDGGDQQVLMELDPGIGEGSIGFHPNGSLQMNPLGITMSNQASGGTFSYNTDASSLEFSTFRNNGTQKGAIVGSANATAYQTSSDYRLKQNVDYDWDATTECKKLKPCQFKWIDDVTIEDGGGATAPIITGFLAHELQAVVPDAAFGVKDATETYINDDGDSATRIKPQGIDQSKIISILTKTIQELEARITAGGL